MTPYFSSNFCAVTKGNTNGITTSMGTINFKMILRLKYTRTHCRGDATRTSYPVPPSDLGYQTPWSSHPYRSCVIGCAHIIVKLNHYAGCPSYRVPECCSCMPEKACFRRNIPATAEVLRDAIKGTLCLITYSHQFAWLESENVVKQLKRLCF